MILIVMGVCGCGKTEIAKELASQLNWPFIEGDKFHPPGNVTKMATGNPLNDIDRAGWLDQLHYEIVAHINRDDGNGVLTCSALKTAYRKQLIGRESDDKIIFVYLQVSREVLEARLGNRKNHFMPSLLLQSQLDILEPPPMPTERADRVIQVNADQSIPQCVAFIQDKLRAMKNN